MDIADLPRSYLYVPGYRPDMMSKADTSEADAVIYDLEDAVPFARKVEARNATSHWLARGGTSIGGHAAPQRWVRVNVESLVDDVVAVASRAISGIVVPKASVALLATADEVLTQSERRLGVPGGSLRIVALVETAKGVLRAADLAAMPRVVRLGVGAADLSAELGTHYDGTELRELAPLLMQVVLASASAGLYGPISPASIDFHDLDALSGSTASMYGMGFRARTCIHPIQVEPVNRAFTPSPDEIEQARKLLAAYDESVSRGNGVLTDAHGRLVDEAIVRHARDTVARATQRKPPG